MSDGLAFAEEKEMKKLTELAENGWFLDSFAFLGYTLRKDTPQKIIYSVDYQDIANDRKEYMDMFRAAGWEHVCSAADIHIFSAPAGTKPIYTDQHTKIEKYERGKKGSGILGIVLILLTVMTDVIDRFFINSGDSMTANIVHYTFLFFCIISFPVLMVYARFQYKIYRLRKRISL